MATFVHPTAYRFYAQRYPNGDTAYPKKDIEETYSCRYMRFDNLEVDGDIGNTYVESFVEKSGDKVYIPPKSDLTHKSYDCKLKLLFKGDNVQANVRQFAEDWMGVKMEYSDTFRNRYATLLMTKAPNIVSQRLYGQEYAEVEFTFSNIDGVTYDTTRL